MYFKTRWFLSSFCYNDCSLKLRIRKPTSYITKSKNDLFSKNRAHKSASTKRKRERKKTFV